MNESQWTQREGPVGGPMDPRPRTQSKKKTRKKWPLYVMGFGASVTIWGGWVKLGSMTGFGKSQLFPGWWDSFHLNLAITLPLGMEMYAAYAFGVWLDRSAPKRAKAFAKWSSVISSALGMGGQAMSHILITEHKTVAPWWVTVTVSCFPVLAALLGAILHQLLDDEEEDEARVVAPGPVPSAVHAEQVPIGPSTAQVPRSTAPVLPAGPTEKPLALDPPPVDPGPTGSAGTGSVADLRGTDPADPALCVDPGNPMDPAQSTETLAPMDPGPRVDPAGAGGPAPRMSEGPKPTRPVARPKPDPSPKRPRELQAVAEDGDQVIHTVGARRVLLRDVATLLPKAREINEEHQVQTGRDIGAQKLANVMKIHKATAGGLLKVIKAERDGAVGGVQAAAQ